MNKAIEILLVEDNPADIKLTQVALRKTKISNNINVVRDGNEALAYLRKEGEHAGAVRPDLILLDLNLPLVSGFDVLEYLKTDPILKKIPVLVLSGSSSLQDIGRCYELGANSYILKPTGIDELLEMTGSLLTFWFRYAQILTGSKALKATQSF